MVKFAGVIFIAPLSSQKKSRGELLCLRNATSQPYAASPHYALSLHYAASPIVTYVKSVARLKLGRGVSW